MTKLLASQNIHSLLQKKEFAEPLTKIVKKGELIVKKSTFLKVLGGPPKNVADK